MTSYTHELPLGFLSALLSAAPLTFISTSLTMAPRWLAAVARFVMKRKKGRAHVQDYEDDSCGSDDDDDGMSRGRRRRSHGRTERHVHVDRVFRAQRTTVQTQYYDLLTSPQKRRASSVPLPASASTPSLFDPSLAPIDTDFLYSELDRLGESAEPRKRTAGVSLTAITLSTWLRIPSQDRPLLQWIPEVDAYLDELLRLEGRGCYTEAGCCCGGEDAAAVYRCEDCCDLRLYCKTCVVSSHAAHPLHRLQVSTPTLQLLIIN